MDGSVDQLVRKIHDGDGRVALAVAGAGTLAAAWLFGVPGASRTMVEAQVPYATAAFQQYVAREPEKYASARAARFLAAAAFRRAVRLEGVFPGKQAGVACAAAIATDRQRRGTHRAFVAGWTRGTVWTIGFVLEKGARTRWQEETVVSRLVVQMVARVMGVPVPNGWLRPFLTDADTVTEQVFEIGAAVDRLLADTVDFMGVYADGRVKTAGINPQLLLSGSFNPLHEGHTDLAATAADLRGKPVAFELSAANADKPSLEKEVVLQRVAQFAGRHPIYVTNAPTFIEKARLFPHTTFVVGYDTAVRILMPKYYDGADGLFAALDEMRDRGCDFLVAGRTADDGMFHPAGELDVPDGYEALFSPIPADEFRRDISSTEIRQRRDVSRETED